MALRLSGNNLFSKNFFDISPEDGQGLIFAGDRQLPESKEITEGKLPLRINDDFSDASIDTAIWETGVGGSASVTEAGGVVTLATGTTINSSCYFRTIKTFNLSKNGNLKAEFDLKAVYGANYDKISFDSGFITSWLNTNGVRIWHLNTTTPDDIAYLATGDGVNGNQINETFTENTSYSCKIIATKEKIEIYINGILKFSSTDKIATNSNFYLMFYVKTYETVDKQLIIDNVKVYYN